MDIGEYIDNLEMRVGLLAYIYPDVSGFAKLRELLPIYREQIAAMVATLDGLEKEITKLEGKITAK